MPSYKNLTGNRSPVIWPMICLAVLGLAMACAQSGRTSSTPIAAGNGSATALSQASGTLALSVTRLPAWTVTPTGTSTPEPTTTPTPTELPFPDASGVCVLYRSDGALWIQKGNMGPQIVGAEGYGESDTECPPETLLPQVEVNPVDFDGAYTAQQRHLIPHLCRRHPEGQEVWFNTERPMGYGKHYNSDLWRYDASQDVVEPILEDRSGGQFFQFSPDGQSLVLSSDEEIRLMRLPAPAAPDASALRTLLEFPTYSICSEVNVWVTPMWLPDSSGMIVHIPEGCLNTPQSWPFGLWWVPLSGEASSIHVFPQSSIRMLDSRPGPRELDAQRFVNWYAGTIYLEQAGFAPLPLAPLRTLEEGYVGFLCMAN